MRERKAEDKQKNYKFLQNVIFGGITKFKLLYAKKFNAEITFRRMLSIQFFF